VYRIVQRFLNTGCIAKSPYPKERAARKLTDPAKLFVLQLVLEKPGITLHEIQEQLLFTLFIQIDLANICRLLQQSGFTRQKLRITALQQSKYSRQCYMEEVSIYNPEMFIFLDETGADRRNVLRRYGYSMRGRPIVNQQLLFRGCRISALAFISMCGLLDVKLVQGTTDGDTFYNFVKGCLLPHLLPFDGSNPHSVVIMDNCSIHHIGEVVKMIEEVGAIVHFLPPYSPDFMPTELAFSKVKMSLKMNGMEDVADLETALLEAFVSITPQDCQGWISERGLYN